MACSKIFDTIPCLLVSHICMFGIQPDRIHYVSVYLSVTYLVASDLGLRSFSGGGGVNLD